MSGIKITVKKINRKKIAVVTGSRAEYGLLRNLIKEINESDSLDLNLIVTGSHLSKEYGNTIDEISADGFNIDNKVMLDLNEDSEESVAKAISLGISEITNIFANNKPDLALILGDRYEIFSVAIAALICRLPVAHIHGGERTEGVIDESIRHSITKMSHLHFTATEEYRKRVAQLGEKESTIYNVGAIGIDDIMQMKFLSKDEIEKKFEINFNKRNLLITFHPVTLDQDSSKGYLKNLLDVLLEQKDTTFIFTKANADMEGKQINSQLEEFVRLNPKNSYIFPSMGRLNYLSTMLYVDGILGNSSSGIIEAPSMKVPTVNIGNRQKGRIMAKSVISCNHDSSSIRSALQKLFSLSFQQQAKSVINPYGEGGASKKIYDIIKKTELDKALTKEFSDIQTHIYRDLNL